MIFTTTIEILPVRTDSMWRSHQTPIFYRGRAHQTSYMGGSGGGGGEGGMHGPLNDKRPTHATGSLDKPGPPDIILTEPPTPGLGDRS
jgi:hypothetical protein